jgi:hypothetical protein
MSIGENEAGLVKQHTMESIHVKLIKIRWKGESQTARGESLYESYWLYICQPPIIGPSSRHEISKPYRLAT